MKWSEQLLVPAAMVFATAGLASQTPSTWAGDSWTSFRNGGLSQSNQSLPTQWTPDSGIAWQTELSGYGQSAPVIHNDRIIVTSVLGPNRDQAVVQCFSLSDGKSLWSYQRDSSVGHPSNYMNSRAAPTPIVYGVAAADGRLAIRTGTRLYVVSGPN